MKSVSMLLIRQHQQQIRCIATCLRTYTSLPPSTSTGSQDQSQDTPAKNMLELYKSNPQWLGYTPQGKLAPLTKSYLAEKRELERKKSGVLTSEDISRVAPQDGQWRQGAVRCGAIGVKLGTTTMWTKEGFRHAVTVIQIRECTVLDTQLQRGKEVGGYSRKTQMILGSQRLQDDEVLANMSRDKIQWYTDRGLTPPQFWARMEVTPDALLHPGTEITAQHFVVGQKVMVLGVTKDKGFEGVMKRWGMKGQPATHGQTKTHRRMGASGGGTNPGRIFPGKRMPGHKGAQWRSSIALKVFRIVPEFNIIMVRGQVPGPTNGFLIIRDNQRWSDFPGGPPPFPTYFPPEEEKIDDGSWKNLYADQVAQPTDPSLEFPPYKL